VVDMAGAGLVDLAVAADLVAAGLVGLAAGVRVGAERVGVGRGCFMFEFVGECLLPQVLEPGIHGVRNGAAEAASLQSTL
jgi:hypothetical protein